VGHDEDLVPRGYIDGPAAVVEGVAALAIHRFIEAHRADWLDFVAPYARLGPTIARARASLEKAARAHVDQPVSARPETSAEVAETGPSSAGMYGLTTSDAAELLKRSPRRIRQLIDDGRLVARRDGSTWIVDRESVEQLKKGKRR